MNRNELLNILTQGPQSDALCLRCQNNTIGEHRCEGCIHGYFRGAEDYRLPCRKCHCQVYNIHNIQILNNNNNNDIGMAIH